MSRISGARRCRPPRACWSTAATLARHSYGDAHSALGPDVLGLVLGEPVGVVAMITPWNFPLLIVSQKLPFALAVGDPCFRKRAEHYGLLIEHRKEDRSVGVAATGQLHR